MSNNRLQSDPLFQGLTRPAMMLGVSYMFFVLNAIVCMVVFINMQSFLVVPLAVVIHFIGYLICLKEPRAIEMLLVKMKKGMRGAANRSFHGNTNSYDPLPRAVRTGKR